MKTVEELDALPVDSVVILSFNDPYGGFVTAYQKGDNGQWLTAGDERPETSYEILNGAQSVKVLWQP